MAREEGSAVAWDRSKDSRTTSQAAKFAKNRMTGVVQGLVGGIVGSVMFTFWHRVAGSVVLSIAGLVTACALLSPGFLYEKIRIGVEKFAGLVGIVVTWVALLPIYYLFFTPFHFLFRRGRKDAMARAIEKDRDSYWNVREGGAPDAASYERQF